jgi:peptidoglycan/xylan/chitin deacetylase (PgdA/CDA1 family)
MSEELKEEVYIRFKDKQPEEWGRNVDGVRSRLETSEKEIALTLDACDGHYDRDLIAFLVREQIPATLFISGIWLETHSETVIELADNPLFEIANHGLQHQPCSVTEQNVEGFDATNGLRNAIDEISENAKRIKELTGIQTRFYRSGTAHYDEVCTGVAEMLGMQVAGYQLIGDGGAEFTSDEVYESMLRVEPGSIIQLHMRISPTAARLKDSKKPYQNCLKWVIRLYGSPPMI